MSARPIADGSSNGAISVQGLESTCYGTRATCLASIQDEEFAFKPVVGRHATAVGKDLALAAAIGSINPAGGSIIAFGGINPVEARDEQHFGCNKRSQDIVCTTPQMNQIYSDLTLEECRGVKNLRAGGICGGRNSPVFIQCQLESQQFQEENKIRILIDQGEKLDS